VAAHEEHVAEALLPSRSSVPEERMTEGESVLV
jgi:hypothetical protein